MSSFESGAQKFIVIACMVVGGIWLVQHQTSFDDECVYCTEIPHYSDGCLHDVNNPLFNAREAAKQAILLEGHLFDPRQQCVDCIRKHFLHLEALLEEAVTLDKNGGHKYLHGIPRQIRALIAAYNAGVMPSKIAQGLRTIRKKLAQQTFTSVS